MTSLARIQEMVDTRGPRYVIQGTVYKGEHMADYALNAEEAEATRRHYEKFGWHPITVHPPVGSVDLGALGRERADAQRVLEEKTAILRAGVLRALKEGRAEAEVARQAGVDRMTVRSWAGK